MSDALTLVILLAVVALTTALVPFLIQLRKTAAAMEKLAESASRDISRITEDVHATRERIDQVAARIEQAAEKVSSLPTTVAGLGGTLRTAVDLFVARPLGGGVWGPIVTAIGSLLGNWLASRRSGLAKKAPTSDLPAKGEAS